MRHILNIVSAIALVTTMSACNRSEAPAENAAATSDTNAMMAEGTNPFAQAEMKMQQAMDAAVGISPADNWVRKMIAHHQGAVDMSRIGLQQNLSAEAATMAQGTIDKQSKEIVDLQQLVEEGAPDEASAALYRPAMMAMHDAMMSAKGADATDTFLRKMLGHHQGAIAMSDVALNNGSTGKVRAQVEKTRADQQNEATMVEGMLSGKPMTH